MLVLLLLVQQTLASILASSSVQQCYQNDKLQCSQKMLVSLTVENGQMAPTESIQITQLDNGTILEKPITITFTKTPSIALHPLKYVQDFNSQPLELVISSSVLDCTDAPLSANPTCGWQTDSNGNNIPYSQGFCCSCSLSQIVGLDNEQLNRGNSCQAFNIAGGSATAHCLRYSNLWYSAYEIGSYQIYYQIGINIVNGDQQHDLHLGSTQFVNQDELMVATLIGDFSPLSPPEAFESMYLMKPSLPITNARVLEGSKVWMMVPQNMVTKDGTQCNQIGVSYSAFQNQPNSCGNPVGSCLLNQLENLYQDDLKRLSSNQQPNYLLSRYGNFSQVTNAQQTYLMQQIDGKMPTLITLEINAKAVQFVSNLGNATIDIAEVRNFESHSGNGILFVQVTNIGQLSAEFQLSTFCSAGVQPLQGKSFYLNPYQSQQYQTQIDVQPDTGMNYSCTLTLQNSIGTIVAQKQVNFSTTSQTHTNQQNNNTQQLQNTTVQQEQPEQKSATCSQYCSNFWDFICFLKNGCYQQFYRFLSIVLIIIIMLMAITLCLKKRKYLCRKKKKQKIIYEAPTQDQSIIIRPSRVEDKRSSDIKEYVYANLMVGHDHLASKIGHDISVRLKATYEKQILSQLKLSLDSRVPELFKQIYKSKWRGKLAEFLEQLRQQSLTYTNLITKVPMFRRVLL